MPINCLDVLAQQIVALAAMEDWDVPKLYALVRQAYPFRDLSAQAFETTLEMVSGRYQFQSELEAPSESTDTAAVGPRPSRPRSSLESLQPRVSWDRVHNRVLALPGTRSLALTSGGTIPDTGQYAVYAPGGVRIGELDEEFIYERRIGDTFLLGTNAWRLEKIEADRVQVVPAVGAPAMVPFWRGEGIGRTYDLGLALGVFLREFQARVDTPDLTEWLQENYYLDTSAARNLRHHVSRQLLSTNCLPTDVTAIIEASRDQLGDWQLVFLCPLGTRLHLTLRLALGPILRQRLGYQPQCLHHSDGLLVRLIDMDEPILDLLAGLTPENVEALVLEELADSALFALRFRQNAARALLLPRGRSGKRAPLWLQRMRGRDLLQVARKHPDFPVVVETFRECLHDHLDLPRLRELLESIQAGRVKVVARRAEAPSPFASSLLFSFNMAYQYQYDGVEPEKGAALALDKQLLEQLVSPRNQEHLLDPRAVGQVERRLRGLGQPPRSVAEMAEWLRRIGDLGDSELEGSMAEFLGQLQADGRAVRIDLPGVAEPGRWVATEEALLYRQAFGLIDAEHENARAAGKVIFERFLKTHALVGLGDLLERYPFERDWTIRQLDEWTTSGRVVAIGGGATMQWSAPANLDQVQRGSLALLRREVLTCPPQQFADFLLRWQNVHPEARRGGGEGIAAALERVEGLPILAEVWERAILPIRVPSYQGALAG